MQEYFDMRVQMNAIKLEKNEYECYDFYKLKYDLEF